MSTICHFHLHPSAFASVGILPDDVDSIVDCLLAIGPERVTIVDFDLITAAAIADRLVGHKVRVHVEGSGLTEWPDAGDVYEALLLRLRLSVTESFRQDDMKE